MTTDREIEEATARCLSIAVFYHNSPKAHRSEELFEDDVRSVARWVAEAGLSEREANLRLFEPLHSELVSRYGVEVGPSLRADFLSAYRDAWRPGGRPAPARPPMAFSPLISRGPLRK